MAPDTTSFDEDNAAPAPHVPEGKYSFLLRPGPKPPATVPALGPCEGCGHFARCTAEVICCEAFVLFVRVGNDYNAARWKWAPRQPSAAILERLCRVG
jgi:hypothetical protein